MELYGIDINPVPDDAVVGAVMASDGVRLRSAHWRPRRRRPLGTVCLFQGRAECIEKYFEVIEDLRGRGFVVATFDWRGQGGSERRTKNPDKGHVDSFEEYDRDLDAFMQQVALPDCPPPHFGLGHSTGALIALRAARAGRATFSRMMLTAPMVGLATRRPPQSMILAGTALLTAIGLGELKGHNPRFIHEGRFEGNPLTTDPERFARIVAIYRDVPQITASIATYGWLYAACRAMAEAREPGFAPAIGVPILILSGMRDEIVSAQAVESLAAELRAGSLSLLAGARHELMMERDELREQFWAAFDAFVPGS
ncbi:MAG: alpha/beta hydrolase [Hyphomicrobiales bacterium]|nr:alpha/beta hydrolase [Hyphomicrobiales bacterium]